VLNTTEGVCEGQKNKKRIGSKGKATKTFESHKYKMFWGGGGTRSGDGMGRVGKEGSKEKTVSI